LRRSLILWDMTLRRKPNRRWPRKLVGDTPGLRARFRSEYPTIPIDLAAGSAYRAWLNAERRTARPVQHRKGRTRSSHPRPARRVLLQEAFMRAIQSGDASPRSREGTSVSYDYYGWLRSKGIDPDTGKMTLDGFAFFRSLIEQHNARNRPRRDDRRRRAA
jgi:hypothetical protein